MRSKFEQNKSSTFLENLSGDTDYISRIREKYGSMSKTSKKIARYIQEHQSDVVNNSITILAKKIGTSPASVSRFCQDLHYKGYSDMRFCLEKNLYSPFHEFDPVNMQDSISEVKRKFISLYNTALTDTLRQLKDTDIERVVAAINKANRVYIYGNGGSGVSASIYWQTFLQLGVPCNVFTENQLALMSASHLSQGDVAIGITYSGNATLVLDSFKLLRNKGITLVGITSHINSPITKMVNILLNYSFNIEDDLRYLHMARMCEMAILGQIQSGIINSNPKNVQNRLEFSKNAITQTRTER